MYRDVSSHAFFDPVCPAYIFPFIYVTNLIKAIMDFQIPQKYYIILSIVSEIKSNFILCYGMNNITLKIISLAATIILCQNSADNLLIKCAWHYIEIK